MEELERDVGATVEEFRRGLLAAFPGAVQGGPLRYAVVLASAAMDIDVVPAPDRIIALLRLPRLVVRIRFTAGSAAARQALLAQMDRAMHRGGG